MRSEGLCAVASTRLGGDGDRNGRAHSCPALARRKTRVCASEREREKKHARRLSLPLSHRERSHTLTAHALPPSPARERSARPPCAWHHVGLRLFPRRKRGGGGGGRQGACALPGERQRAGGRTGAPHALPRPHCARGRRPARLAVHPVHPPVPLRTGHLTERGKKRRQLTVPKGCAWEDCCRSARARGPAPAARLPPSSQQHSLPLSLQRPGRSPPRRRRPPPRL